MNIKGFAANRFKSKNIFSDVVSGIIVALVSIPISMGYAQVAGLPAVYGLYGSLLPILVFGLISSSKHFVVGVDAMPAAMTGSVLAAIGVEAGSAQAIKTVPVITLFCALWLFAFFIFKAGRIVKYISTPVMGGFISGVGFTIILMQVPKLYGGTPGTGEIYALVGNIFHNLSMFNPLSAVLGFGTVALILSFKKISPKFPMSVVLLAAGAFITIIFKADKYGVALLPQVPKGLPNLSFPNPLISMGHFTTLALQSLAISLVIMAQTLLGSGGYAQKYNYKINNNRELLAYSAANIAGCISGSCPINGSVSRSGIADQFGCSSQLMSLSASASMLVVLLFCTELLQYLPVPILTGIVVSALISILETKLAVRLFKENKREFFIFTAVFLGVLVLGTVLGVVLGIVLSFASVVLCAVVPPKSYVGLIPGHEDFYSLNRNHNARPIKNTVIYRFGGNLFFGNINTFAEDIENALTPATRCVIVDAKGIGDIDITAADRLVALNKSLQSRGILFYITEHEGSLNDKLRKYGAGSLVESGVVRRTISLALRDAGIEKPYPLEGVALGSEVHYIETEERLAEFEWAFGRDSEQKLMDMAKEIMDKLTNTENASLESISGKLEWGKIGLFDEEALLDYMEAYISEQAAKHSRSGSSILSLEQQIINRRITLAKKLKSLNPKAAEILRTHRINRLNKLKQSNPEVYKAILAREKRIYSALERENLQIAKEFYSLPFSE